MTDSGKLLQDYAENGSEAAFRELVNRYLNLVYGTAMRVLGGNAALAQEVGQMVFIDLARNARKLPPDVRLGGWLHRDTCFVASKLIRSESRRRLRETQALEMNSQADHSEANLAAVVPLLDEAVNKLPQTDRTAIVLRFFEQWDLRRVGETLGLSENAAQKRISRALEQLRVLLKRRGVVLSMGALSSLLAAESIAAPSGLGLTISTAASGAGASATGALTLLKLIAMTKTNIGIAGACMMAGIIASLLVHHQAQATLRDHQAAFQQQADKLPQPEPGANELSSGNQSGSSPSSERESLVKLRREAGLLRSQTNSLAILQRENRRLTDLQKSPLAMVEQTKQGGMLRMNYMKEWMLAFQKFADEHGGEFPSSFDQARGFLSTNATEMKLTTDQFEIVYRGIPGTLSHPANVMVIREKNAWADYTGQSWVRAYGFADGHSEIHKIPGVRNAEEAAQADTEMEAWEKDRLAAQSQP